MRHILCYSSNAYVPYDELESILAIRIMRAIRFFDWATVADIRDALDIGEDDRQKDGAGKWRKGNHMSSTLRQLIQRGALVRRGDVRGYEYRLSERGRRLLSRTLKRAEVDWTAEDA